MQTPHSIVYLYSKFSNYCNNFSKLLSENGIEFVTPVCVDNKEVRNKILSSSSLQINIVPCLLFVYSTGHVEKYEGEGCFKWLNELVQSKQTSPTEGMIEEEKMMIEDDFVEVPPPQRKKINKRQPLPPPPEEEENEEEEELPPPPPKRKNKREIKTLNEIDANKVTSLDDLMEEKTSEPVEKKEIFIERGSNENLPIKKDNASQNLMAKAQEMQKMREEIDSVSKKPPPFPPTN